MLSALGGAVGLVVAVWAADLLVRSIETILPFSMAVFGVGIDWRVVTGHARGSVCWAPLSSGSFPRGSSPAATS